MHHPSFKVRRHQRCGTDVARLPPARGAMRLRSIQLVGASLWTEAASRGVLDASPNKRSGQPSGGRGGHLSAAIAAPRSCFSTKPSDVSVHPQLHTYLRSSSTPAA